MIDRTRSGRMGLLSGEQWNEEMNTPTRKRGGSRSISSGLFDGVSRLFVGEVMSPVLDDKEHVKFTTNWIVSRIVGSICIGLCIVLVCSGYGGALWQLLTGGGGEEDEFAYLGHTHHDHQSRFHFMHTSQYNHLFPSQAESGGAFVPPHNMSSYEQLASMCNRLNPAITPYDPVLSAFPILPPARAEHMMGPQNKVSKFYQRLERLHSMNSYQNGTSRSSSDSSKVTSPETAASEEPHPVMHTAHNYIIEHLLSPAECKYIIDESEEFARQIQRNKHQRLLEKEKLPTDEAMKHMTKEDQHEVLQRRKALQSMAGTGWFSEATDVSYRSEELEVYRMPNILYSLQSMVHTRLIPQLYRNFQMPQQPKTDKLMSNFIGESEIYVVKVNYEGFVTFKEHFDGGQFNIIIPLNTDYSGGRYILKAINKELQMEQMILNSSFTTPGNAILTTAKHTVVSDVVTGGSRYSLVIQLGYSMYGSCKLYQKNLDRERAQLNGHKFDL